MIQASQGAINSGATRRAVRGPSQGIAKVCRHSRMQPTFVIWHHGCSAHKPDTGFYLFDQHLPAGELFTQRNLAIGANDLDADRICCRC